MIEEGWVDHPILHLTVAEYVEPYLKKYSRGVALLGCTHYPWIQTAFEKALPGWTILNSAQAVADALERHTFIKEALVQGKGPCKNQVEWIFTDPEALPRFASQFLN